MNFRDLEKANSELRWYSKRYFNNAIVINHYSASLLVCKKKNNK